LFIRNKFADHIIFMRFTKLENQIGFLAKNTQYVMLKLRIQENSFNMFLLT